MKSATFMKLLDDKAYASAKKDSATINKDVRMNIQCSSGDGAVFGIGDIREIKLRDELFQLQHGVSKTSFISADAIIAVTFEAENTKGSRTGF